MQGPIERPWDHTGFVFAALPSLTFGLHKIPSIDNTLFFGGTVGPPGPRPRRWAVGYQPTFSFGGAERYAAGIFTHRHHLLAMVVGERHLFASLGGGAAFLHGPAVVVELEGRLGYVFGKPPLGRALGVIGLMTRVGWNLGKQELYPLPQFGLFVGVICL
ncbi:MAG: hypothetical protein KC636_33245 [Myxococcales bacterium]|nr:hypothetical protein [Myxococcales bacterium]